MVRGAPLLKSCILWDVKLVGVAALYQFSSANRIVSTASYCIISHQLRHFHALHFKLSYSHKHSQQ